MTTSLQKEAGRPRIVDLVFARGTAAGAARTRVAVAIGLALTAHGIAFAWALSTRAPLEAWTASAATRIAAEIGRDRSIDIPPPPPPPPEVPPPEPASPPPRLADPTPQIASRAPRNTPPAAPPAPAQAGQIVSAPDDAPADLTSAPFVVGDGETYAGGATTSSGTSREPAPAHAVSGGTGPATAPPRAPRGPDRSRPVSLPDDAWSCPWPAEAETADLDEAVTVIRVRVAADGKARAVTVLADPGLGFGAAATACARGTRFTPARDHAGTLVEADSPPIRVRFTR